MGGPMTLPAPLPARVFVYGTLLPGERNAAVARRGGRFSAQPGEVSGFRLFHLHPEGYPGLIPGGPEERVQGAVLSYDPADWGTALPFLDELEGLDEVPPLYTRERVSVRTQAGEVSAWLYVYARPERLAEGGVTWLPEGDWRVVGDRASRGPDER